MYICVCVCVCVCVGCCSQKLKKAKQTALLKTPSKSGKKLLAGSGVSPLVKQVALSKLKPERKLKKSSKLNLLSVSAVKPIAPETQVGSNLSVPIGVGGISVPVFDPTASKLSVVDPSGAPPNAVDTSSQGEEQAEKPPPPPKEPPVLPESSLPPDVLAKVKDLEEVNIMQCTCTCSQVGMQTLPTSRSRFCYVIVSHLAFHTSSL